MLDLLLPGAALGLLAFFDEDRQFRIILLALVAVGVLVLISMLESLQELAALGYEIRNLRAYIRPRSANPVARPGSLAEATPPVSTTSAESSVLPVAEGTEL